VDELIEDLCDRGFAVVRVHFPRSYVDVNREPYELDPRMFVGRLPSFANTRSMRVAGGLGTIPRVVGDGQEIYRERLSVEDALGRIEQLYKPYHRALRRLINRVSALRSWWTATPCPRSGCRARSRGDQTW
jgi:N-formylglutamate deformylase